MGDIVMYPKPNPFITDWLKGPRARAIVFELAEMYQALYRETVAKDTGALAASARVYTDIEDDRWTGFMVVGGAGAPHGLPHEYGSGRTNPDNALPAANDLNTILNLMATL
ncbi:hypothetical protein [Nocardia sp. NPDC057227]|uniref:hypothetical protein n=1 Tax=Nocardia sp. NPDC057227 TaxID=3346056 RepID=UPI00362FF904